MNANPPQILLIDDDRDLRTMLSRALTRFGYAVVEAENGREALVRLESATFHVVVTDIIMPDMEGIELILKLHRSHPALPIIAMSAGGRIGPDSYLSLAKRSGAVHTLVKPFGIDEFIAAVKSVLEPSAAPAP